MTFEDQRIFDISSSVEFLKQIGVTGATKNSVRGLIASGKVSHLKIGRKFYITKSALEAWLNRSEKRVR